MSKPTELDPDFLAAVERHGLKLTTEQLVGVQAYCRVLWSWNERLNLTRHTDYEKFVARDLIDTLQLVALLKPNEEVLDLGSGSGVPGIPLAIIRPDLQVSLAESVGKKAKALEAMVRELKLPIAVYSARGEELLGDFRFDTVVARAVGPLRKLATWLGPHWHTIGRLLAVKGPKWVEERGEARHYGALKGVDLRKVAEYVMPGADGPAVILELCRSRPGESRPAAEHEGA
jgi:16S rRNA (guanine527-N7)-methyltransferase